MTTSLLLDYQSSRWVITTAIIAATTFAAYLVNKRHFSPIPGISGPQPEFLIGNIRNFFVKHKDLWSIMKNVQHYGPLVALWIGPKRVIVVNDPNITAEIVKNKDAFNVDPEVSEVLSSLMPGSMVAIQGDIWKRHRKALTPLLATERLRYLLTKMNNTVNYTIKSIKERIRETDEPINIKDDLEYMALDAVGYLAFGRAFRNIDDKDFGKLSSVDFSVVKESIAILSTELGSRLLGFGLHKYIGDSKKIRNMKNVLTEVVHILANEYENNRQKMEANKLEQEEWEKFMDRSFVAQVLSSVDGHDFTFEELRGEMISLILAGTDTTTGTLAFGIKLLSENPHVQEKLYEEIITVIGKDAIPQYEQLQESAMPYLDKVVKEIQRLSLTINTLFRNATKEVIIRDVVFPKGTPFWLCITPMHRDPNYWKDPLVFLPERWNTDGIANGNPVNLKAYLPFGGGTRMCFGMRFAAIELRFMIVAMTRAFFFKELPPHLKDKVGEENVTQNATVELVNIVALPVPRP